MRVRTTPLTGETNGGRLDLIGERVDGGAARIKGGLRLADLVGTQTRDLEFVDRTRARSLLFKHNAAPARVVHVLSRRGVGLPELELAVLGLSCKRKIALHRIELGLRGTDLLLAEALFGQTPLGVKPFGLRFCATALDLERTRVEAPDHVARLHGLAFLPEKLGDAPAPLEGQGHLARIHAAPGHARLRLAALLPLCEAPACSRRDRRRNDQHHGLLSNRHFKPP